MFFNDFFISKIVKLKEGIDKEYVKDPLEKLKKKMEAKRTTGANGGGGR